MSSSWSDVYEKNILEIDNVSFLNLTNSIIVNYIVFPIILFISISKNIQNIKFSII